MQSRFFSLQLSSLSSQLADALAGMRVRAKALRSWKKALLEPALCATVVCAAVLVGCAAKKPRSAEEYFASASENFRRGALAVASEQFRELLDQHPFSPYVEEAELRIAHAHYLEGRYAEAIVALTDFQRRHPTSSQLPFVGYLLGMCYARQILPIDRDQSAAQNALSYFLTVSRQYPTSPFAELARHEVARCRKQLAGHELYVAEFYAQRGRWKAAEVRILELAARYADTPEATRGLLELARYYEEQGLSDRARLAYQAVTQARPGSSDAVRAQRALQRLQGSEPVRAAEPVTVLLALNGRSLVADSFETAEVPPSQPARLPSSAGALPVPAFGTGFDPFGRGRSYY